MAKQSSATKNHKHFVNSSELLSMLLGKSKEEIADFLIQFHQELVVDEEELATIPLARQIIAEGHGFRSARSLAGKKGMESRYSNNKVAEGWQD